MVKFGLGLIIFIGIAWQNTQPLWAQQLSKYTLVYGKFNVLDKNGKPFHQAQLKARLNPQSENQPLDRIIRSENVSYSLDDYEYQLFDSKAQTVNEKGEATLPLIVYYDRDDCINYEMALFYDGKKVSQKTEKYCFKLSETNTSHFIFNSDKYIPIDLIELAKYLPLFLLFIIVTFFLLYRPYYRMKIRSSALPDRAEIYKDKALSLWWLPNLLFLVCILYNPLPPTPLKWVLFGILGLLSLILLVSLCKG